MQLSKKKADEALKDSIRDGSAYSAMDGITSTYATPFALALGAGNAEIGLLNSLPTLFSTLLQPFIGKYIERLGRKEVCESLNFIQRLLIIPIIFIPFLFLNEGVFFFILLSTLSNIALSFANTAWSSWMGSLVPESIRGSYFGKRNTYQSVFSFLTTLLAGWLLGMMNSLAGFSFVFFLAFVFGLVSYFYLTKIPDAGGRVVHRNRLNLLDTIKDFKRYRNFKPFRNHMTLVSFAVNLSAPFFTVYMLSVMKIGYGWYGIVAASEILARILMQRYWGELSDRFGDRNVMALCNILIVFYPFLFLFVRNPFHLVLVSVFSGIAWSGFDLTSFNYLLDVTPPEKRTSYISDFKIATGFALFLGPFTGGLLSQYLSSSTFFWLGGLQILFLLSFILRGAVTAYGLPQLKEVRGGETLPASDIFLKAFEIHPMVGMTHELVYFHHQFQHIEHIIKRKIRLRRVHF